MLKWPLYLIFFSIFHSLSGCLLQEESVAELGDASEGECSSVDDANDRIRRRQDQHLTRELSCSLPVGKKAAEFQVPAPIPETNRRPRFSSDENESLQGHSRHPIPSNPKSTNYTEQRRSTLPADSGSDSKPPPASPVFPQTTETVLYPSHLTEISDNAPVDHSPRYLPKFKEPRTGMWTSSHAANDPSEDRSASLTNVLLQPLAPNVDSETQLPTMTNEYHSLIRLNMWSVIDGHGGGSVATYASEVLLPHLAASIARALDCAIVSRGVCLVNGQLRDVNALDLDGLINTSERRSSNPNSIRYRSPYEDSDSEEEGEQTDNPETSTYDGATHQSRDHGSQSSTSGAPAAAPPLRKSRLEPSAQSVSSGAAASVSSVKTSVKTAASVAPRDAPVGTHSPAEVAAITRAITQSFLAVDEGWINSIDPITTRQTSCQSNGRWNSGACALTVLTIQRLEWTSVSEEHRERGLQGPAKDHGTSQNKDAARRRMQDYVAGGKVSSMSTISSTSSLATTDGRVNASGLESEITETEGEDDDRSMEDESGPLRRRNTFKSINWTPRAPKESLITAPGGCACHCYRAYDAFLYTAHVGDCRAVLLGSAPPRTIKVHGPSASHPDTMDDESSHHSSDETECLSSSDHDAGSSDEEGPEMGGKSPATGETPTPFVNYMRPPTRRARRRANEEHGINAPFIALPPLESFRSIEIELESDGDRHGKRHSGSMSSGSSSSSSRDSPVPIILPPATRPIDLTTDHSAYNPAEVTAVLRRCNNAPRAISAGVGGGIKRVAGSLAVTRALGDAYLKTPMLSFNPYKRHAPYITARPEVNCRPIVKGGDKVLILATDGVWERASGEDILRWVRTYYAERMADVERNKSQTFNNQTDNTPIDGISGERTRDEDCGDDEREVTRSPSPPAKRRKLDSRRSKRRGAGAIDSQHSNTVADVIVRRVLNKVRRARNISTLHALMTLPPGRARRAKHDDVTACVVDLSEFVS